MAGKSSSVNALETGLDVEAVLKSEFKHLNSEWIECDAEPLDAVFKRLHELPEEQRLTALCLSGGGIRSATFSLGVLQSFAQSGRLASFHYLSTVSGGGYVGSLLSNWLRIVDGKLELVIRKLSDRSAWRGTEIFEQPTSTGEDDRDPSNDPSNKSPIPPESKRPENPDESADDPVTRLRAYSNYLSPVWGLSGDSLSLVAIFLRNLILNWLVWGPLLAAAVLVPRVYVSLFAFRPDVYWVSSAFILSYLLVVAGIAYVVADLPVESKQGSFQHEKKGPKSYFAECCFLPIFTAAVVLSVSSAWAAQWRAEVGVGWFFALGVSVHVLGIVIGRWWRVKREVDLRQSSMNLRGAISVTAAGCAGGFLLWTVLRCGGASSDASNEEVLAYAAFAVPAMLASFWLAMTFYAGITGRCTGEDDREWWSRATAWWLYASVLWILMFALVVYLPPLVAAQLDMHLSTEAQVAIGGGLGFLTSAIGYWSKNGSDLKRRATSFLEATRMRMLDLMALTVVVATVVFMSLLSNWSLERSDRSNVLHQEAEYLRSESLLASMMRDEKRDARTSVVVRSPLEDVPDAVRSGTARAYEHVLVHTSVAPVGLALVLLVGFAVGVSRLVGANVFSLHGMYGNRLVRAYLGAARAKRNPHWFTGFDPGDNPSLADCKGAKTADKTVRLFQVVNMAMNLVQPAHRRLAWQQRKAASFTATALHCGAPDVGFVDSKTYGSERGMSLGRAMTISGAAASPNMGYHSSSLVTFVMALFNVRLGWWLPNPSKKNEANWALSSPKFGFWAMLSEAFGRTTDDTASVYLSDGGHFENLGIYEMVRRRCHRIVAVDATCDGEYRYTDLLDSIRKIRVDLGIPIDLPAVLPGPGRDTAHARRVVARIRYSMRDPGAPDGVLIVLKPLLCQRESPDIAHYAAVSKREGSVFPHQSTADQFFDEAQFESYRLLGLTTADEALTDLVWPDYDPLVTTLKKGCCQKDVPDGVPPVPVQSSGDGGGDAIGGLLGAVQSYGATAALATALTVGGAVGAAGTVALSSPQELRLAEEDRALLRSGLTGSMKLSDVDRALLQKDLKLDEATQRILSADLGGSLALNEEDRKLLTNGVKVALSFDATAERHFKEGIKFDVNYAVISELSLAVSNLTTQLKSAAGGDKPSFRDAVDNINKNLEKIDEKVGRSIPKNNVRGQEGGGK